MSTPLKIYQYQSVVYNDTTTGAGPFTLSWSFPGGIPSSGTGSTETVFYNIPGYYTASLTATDIYGTTKTLVEPSLIEVSASSLIAGISGPTPSTIKMNQGYQLDDASVGDPYPATSWLWTLPYGITAGTQNVGVTGYVDWNFLAGGYTAAPGAIYNGDIFLTANNGYNPASASAIVQVQKLGPSEQLYMNATGPVSTNYVTGLTGGLVTLAMSMPTVPAQAQDLGYPSETDFVFHLDYLTRGSTNKLNEYFHSTSESAYATIQTGFWNSNPISDPPIGGYLIINGAVYNPQYSPVPSNDAILYGEYVIQNQTYDLFVVDSTGFLEDKYTNYNYNIDLLSYLITNPYRIIHSGNIQFLNSNDNPGGPAGITFIDPAGLGASGSNPMVYSRAYLNGLGPSSYAPYPVYEVYISAIVGGFPYGATATFQSVGLTGNDPVTSGNFFVAQDNSNGVGIVKILNTAINSSSIPGGTGNIEFVAGSYFNCDYSAGATSGSFDSVNYNGIALLLKNKPLVSMVTITDNSYSLGNSYSPAIAIAPFLGISPTDVINNPQGSTETCSGMFWGPVTPPLSYNVLNFGGSVNYP